MTYDELLSRELLKPQRRPYAHEEHCIQATCVRWFRLQYPCFALLLFAVPNGANKSKVARGMFKAEGLTAGVADLLLLVPRGGFHGLCLEAKTMKGRQSEAQKAWQEAVERQGYKYALFRSFDEFRWIITNYINEREL